MLITQVMRTRVSSWVSQELIIPLFSMLSITGLRNMGMLLSPGRATRKRGVSSMQSFFEFGFMHLPSTRDLVVPSECRRNGA